MSDRPIALTATVLVEQDSRPVFLYGASRQDRQDVARRLHTHGTRSQGPFVVAALTATPRALRDLALFGATGASADRAERSAAGHIGESAGWMPQAQGGTLLIDEIDCLSPDTQERFIAGVTEAAADLRVIIGSRHDPGLLLRQGGLSADFHKWLADIPPERRLGPERIGAVCRLPDYGPASSTERLSGLARVLERPLEDYLEGDIEHGAGNLHAQVVGEVERPLIAMVLRRTSGNQLRAAALLGLNRNTLRKRIRELDIVIPKGIDE